MVRLDGIGFLPQRGANAHLCGTLKTSHASLRNRHTAGIHPTVTWEIIVTNMARDAHVA
ncbi:MAG: hypothetical protein MUF00_04335 [Gemmatimonadaceae bacterium]|jgi:hypothetical protein|nr:hypothetical protein [Gemmatimonadaceae bacterium]